MLAHEGGFVNNKDDPGGATKYGISKKAYPEVDIHALTENEAMQIYEMDYWDRLSVQHLPPSLRLMIFDCAVNQGPARAAIFLQRACGVNADGVVGAMTLKAAHDLLPEFLIDSIARQRMKAYIKNPNWDKFGAGWSARLLDITLTCLTPKL